jgi:hypothetical protein
MPDEHAALLAHVAPAGADFCPAAAARRNAIACRFPPNPDITVGGFPSGWTTISVGSDVTRWWRRRAVAASDSSSSVTRTGMKVSLMNRALSASEKTSRSICLQGPHHEAEKS